MKTIVVHGGRWDRESVAGITHRDMTNDPTGAGGIVAYKYNKNSTLSKGVEF